MPPFLQLLLFDHVIVMCGVLKFLLAECLLCYIYGYFLWCALFNFVSLTSFLKVLTNKKNCKDFFQSQINSIQYRSLILINDRPKSLLKIPLETTTLDIYIYLITISKAMGKFEGFR